MKRRNIYTLIAIALLIALLFPFVWTVHPDGTRVYSAVMVKYIRWTTTETVGEDVVQVTILKVYLFPESTKDYETLRDEFFFNR